MGYESNWTREQFENVTDHAFIIEKSTSVNLDVEHASSHNIAQIIRWAKEHGWYAEEKESAECVIVSKTPIEHVSDTPNIKYRHFKTPAQVELSCLIEDWQNLVRAIKTQDWESVQTTADCLAELIQSAHVENPQLKFQPNACSLIHMGAAEGVIAKPNGTDFTCAAGVPVHNIMHRETCQCGENCMNEHGCNPSQCQFKLSTGHMYTGDTMTADEMLKSLEKN